MKLGMSRPLDIIVPVLNEESYIDEFHARIDRLGYADALIFVDNASTDGTAGRIERLPGARLIRHATNQGYGASIRDGIASSDGERIIVIDADLEYPPEAIPAILGALHDHPAVYASRFLSSDSLPMPFLRRAGNRVVTALFNRLFDQNTTDLYTGMKGLRRAAFELARLQRNGFEHVIELSVRIARSGEKIHDVPVQYAPRSRGVSKMRHVPEAFKFVTYTLAYWLCDVARRRA
jgi:glycosyltransferase involved in cell wall biosynthesis